MTSRWYNWVKPTSAYIKSFDSKHMVCIGDRQSIFLLTEASHLTHLQRASGEPPTLMAATHILTVKD